MNRTPLSLRPQLLLPLGAVLLCAAFAAGWLARPADEAPSTADIAHAERLLGLTFTDAERDSMREELREQRDNYANIRRQHLPNDLGPAVRFDPRPAGWRMPDLPKQLVLQPMPKPQLPKDSTALAYLSVRELGGLLRSRQVSSEQLTRFFLARLKRYDPVLHCVVTLTEDSAIAQARRADAELRRGIDRGPLHGIPYGAKDLLAVRGYPTTWGGEPYRTQRFAADAHVVQRLRDAGAVLVAKLTLGELAYGDVWFGGMTRNPWNLAAGSSGSSAGSASAVSAGLVPFAIGTETLGSIVSPSTVCGTTGLRPTYGRVSTAGAMALTWSMDKIGPIARSVEDAYLVLDAMDELPPSYHHQVDWKRVRVGYIRSAFAGRYGFRAQDSVALAQLRALGAELIPIELPPTDYRALTITVTAEGAAAFAELTEQNRDDLMKRQTKDAWPNLFRAARFIPAVEYVQASRIRSRLIAQMDSLMQQVDVYVAPSWSGNLTLTNLTGHPCVVVPNGFRTAADGTRTPTSISFHGRLYEEGLVAAVAHQYQQATNWHTQHPPLFP